MIFGFDIRGVVKLMIKKEVTLWHVFSLKPSLAHGEEFSYLIQERNGMMLLSA